MNRTEQNRHDNSESITVPRNEIRWLGDSTLLAKFTLSPDGSQGQPKGKERVLIIYSLEGGSQELPVIGGYLNVKVSVFQIQRKEPVPWAYLREDLLRCNHPEWTFHKGAI